MTMQSDKIKPVVGVYWDFENLHASLVEKRYGPSTYQANRFKVQERLIDVRAIMDYAARLGEVAIKRAYGNWQWFSRYADDLNACGLELVQHYPRGMKNGADIRLALDVLEDLYRCPQLDYIIVVGGDSDYISLAQKVNQQCRKIVGVGVRATTNRFWQQTCNEFLFYETLVMESAAPRSAPITTPLPERVESISSGGDKAMEQELAGRLLLRALTAISPAWPDGRVPRTAIKQTMLQIDPRFNEAAIGFPTFSAFIEAFPQYALNIPNGSGGLVRLAAGAIASIGANDIDATSLTVSEAPTPSGANKGQQLEEISEASLPAHYEALLKAEHIRPLAAEWWRPAVHHLEQIFFEAPHHHLPSFDHLKHLLGERLAASGLDGDATLVNRLRMNLFTLKCFTLYGEDGIGLVVEPTEDGIALVASVEAELVRRLSRRLGSTPQADPLATLLYGETDPLRVAVTNRLVRQIASQSIPLQPESAKSNTTQAA